MKDKIPPYYRWELMALLCCAYFFHQVDRAIFGVVPEKLRATVVGLMLLVAMLLGSFSPLLFGWLGNRYGTGDGVALAFSIVSSSWLIGGLCVLTALCFTFEKDRARAEKT